jgi:heme exporter protein C
MKLSWWKILTIVILSYVFVWGIAGTIPVQPILNETARNLYFHVPLWFGLIIMLLVSWIYSILYLRNGKVEHDEISTELINTSIVYSILGFITGAIWGKYTWGSYLPQDPKIMYVGVAMMIYFAYVVLRGSFEDEQRRAKVSAVYNIFAFVLFNVLIIVLPRMANFSLHPGNGGNPGFKIYDSDHIMKFVFYPAVIGYTLLGFWISNVRIRMRAVKRKMEG